MKTHIAPARAALAKARGELLDALKTYHPYISASDRDELHNTVLFAHRHPTLTEELEDNLIELLREYEELPADPTDLLLPIRHFQRTITDLRLLEEHVHRASLATAS
jgi:hypothetical protein